MQSILGKISLILAFLWTTESYAEIVQPDKLDALIEVLEEEMDGVQGGAMAILYKGQVVYQKTFGYRNGDEGEITPDTLFSLASVSKPVAAMAVALLIDQEKLKLDERFKLPYLKNPITLANILSHTTGYKFTGNQEIEKGLDRQKLLEKLKAQKPQCSPGGCYTYSNTAYSLLEDCLNKKGFHLPTLIAGLRKTLLTDGIQMAPIDKSKQVAFPHRATENGLEARPLPPYYPKATPASAGMFASLNGMIAFYKLSFGYRPDLISQKTLDIMQKPVISNHDHEKWGSEWPCDIKQVQGLYALGWRVMRDKELPGSDMIFHGGHLSGVSTFIGYIPIEEIGVIILLNQDIVGAGRVGITFWREAING